MTWSDTRPDGTRVPNERGTLLTPEAGYEGLKRLVANMLEDPSNSVVDRTNSLIYPVGNNEWPDPMRLIDTVMAFHRLVSPLT